MACLLIVDDDTDNARQLCDVLSANLTGDHQFICVQGLAEYRRIRRQHKPDLILVELQRWQSNGFTLAAALTRLSSAPVVLLTDRDLMSDRIWAATRGISCVSSRRSGHTALVLQLDSLLKASCPGTACKKDLPAATSAKPTSSQEAEWSVPASIALLRCVAEEVRQLPYPQPARLPVSGPGWIKNIMLFISDSRVDKTLMALTASAGPDGDLQWLEARERALLLLDPAADTILQALCEGEWAVLCRLLNTGHGDQAAITHRCRQLLNVLVFLPAAQIRNHYHETVEISDLSALVEQIERGLAAGRQQSARSALINAGCWRVLGCVTAGNGAADKQAWRELVGLGLSLRAVTGPECWLPIMEQSATVLYGWHNARPEITTEVLLGLTLRLLDDEPAGPLEKNHQTTNLMSDYANKLSASLSALQRSLMLLQDQPGVPAAGRHARLHQRLTHLMVGIYKLRSWFEFGKHAVAEADRGHLRWRLVLGCLYECICHGVQQSDALTADDIKVLTNVVQGLQRCPERGQQPSDSELMNLAALEITVYRRLQAGSDLEHQVLAAGLNRLPRPESIVPELMRDIPQSGTVLSEITHELMLLTEGARQLGVVTVESLARLLLDCYQHIAARPELLQRKTLRLAVGRAHRVLCRLLDQAAAWLPLDQGGGGQTLSAVIDDLFVHFDYSAQPSTAVTAIGAVTGTDCGHAAWVRCQSLNRRLRQLTRRADNLSAYRSLMAELLNEQQSVMAPHLPYQESG